MHLMHKFLNSCLLINSRVEYTPTYIKKRWFLSYMKMSDTKKKTSSSSSSQVSVEVLGSGAVGVPGNVVLDVGTVKYLINCGEGTQKLGNEYRLSFQKVSHIFITSPSWKNISGLLGVSLSRDKSVAEFCIHGHTCIENVFSGTHKFINKKFTFPNIKRCHHYEEFSNNNISVKYVLLYSKNNKNSSENLINTPDKGESSGFKSIEEDIFSSSEKEISHLSKNDKSDTKTNRKYLNEKSLEKFTESPKKNHNYVISYIFHTHSTPGSLIFEKCVELGVPPGPLLGVLKSGRDVTLSNGKLVKSVDVKCPDLPGVNFIVVECPTEDYLDSLLNEPIYTKYQSGEERAGAVIHFSSSQVVKNPKYQAWIKRFENETKHLFINEDNKLSGSVSIRRQQFKLNYLHPTIFPLLQDAEIPDYPRAENCNSEKGHVLVPITPATGEIEPLFCDRVFYKCENNSFISGETLCSLNLKSKYEYDYMKCLVLKKDQFLKEMFKVDIKGEIEKCKAKLKEIEHTIESDKTIYPKVVFLGTGSGKPSKTRNASGILIFLEENKCMIFDCGENTFNQLINLYGEKKTKEVLRSLIAIYVSHPHVDHHMGLITLLKERKLAFDKQDELLVKDSNMQGQEQIIQPVFHPIYLLAPAQIMSWLTLFSEKFENISDLFIFLPNSSLINKTKDLKSKKEGFEKSSNLSSVMTTPVCHIQGSYGISIAHQNGWKITYSGDTRPCDDLVKIGMDSDILIHEATFEDSYAFEAKFKNHSTTSEALDVGRKMRAKYILLTHFSQRYCYLPVIENNYKYLNIGMAFDFMEVPFNKLPLLPALLEPVQYIFSEYDTKTKRGSILLKRKQNEASISSAESSMERQKKSAKILKQELEI